MTEELRESYDSGEVVWVKLGSSWWPGEVKNADELPTEVLDFKKPPLAIVKFFDEDSYEYVKTWVNIYPYNCDKKNEFIKKGMAAFRAKMPHMEKFPKDVLKAEEKLGGNINILSDPMFLPEKKRNYAAEVFGTPSPKTNTPKNKRRSNKSSGKKDTSHITHRRFLGADDYRAYICIQYPGKDRIPGDREDEEVLRINREPEQDFNCHSCNFSTKRLEVMILHTKSHIKGVYLSSAWKNKQSTSRRRKEKPRKKRKGGSDTLDSDSNSSDSEAVSQKKRKPRNQAGKRKKAKTEEEKPQEPPKKDIRSELLEAWEDSEEDEDLDVSFDQTKDSTSKTGDASSSEEQKQKKSDSVDGTDPNDSTQSEILDEAKSVEKSPPQTIEEALNDVSGELEDPHAENVPLKPVGEQLSTEKLLSTLEDDSMDVDDKEDDKVAEKKKEEGKELKKGDVVEEERKSDSEDDTSKQRMDKDMHEAIKSCFDFDEDEEEDNNAIVGKATSGRKIPRVIPKKTAKKATEETETDPKEKGQEEDMDAAFKELMEITSVPDLPDVQNTLKCEQNFHNIKTIKFPDKTEKTADTPPPLPPAKERKDSSTEVATKLTNPKKRFVKSFEDFELMQNEIRRREEEQMETAPRLEYNAESGKIRFSLDGMESKGASSALRSTYSDQSEEEYSPDSNIELSKLKSKIMSKIIEEAKINTESKNKILAKMQEPKSVEPPVTAESEVLQVHEKVRTTKSSHRTPRSKILESYRKDASKRKAEEKREPPEAEEKIENVVAEVSKILESYKKDSDKRKVDKVGDSSSTDDRLKEVVPPVRKKWSRRGSHPKKDKNLFMMQDVAPESAPVDVPVEKPPEPAKNEDQTVFEAEPITDPEKINDIILGNVRAASPVKDLPPKEVIEEEIVEEAPKEVVETVQPELQPIVEEKEEAVEKLPPTEEIVENETPSGSVELEVGKTKEILPVEEPVIDVGEPEVVKDTPEPVEETNRESTEEVPPTEVLESEIPSETPYVQQEKGLVVEEEVKIHPEEEIVPEPREIPSTEEDVGDIPLPMVEQTTVVPLPETKASEIEEPALEVSETAQKEIVEESVEVPPTVLDPPKSPLREDVVIPPKKSKKRKISEAELGLTPIESESMSLLKFDDFVPSEKRKKDTEVIEEEISAPLPSVEDIGGVEMEKNDLEVPMEVEEPLRDEPEEKLDQVPQVEEKIEEIEENKENRVDIEDVKDETKEESVMEESVDNAETDKVLGEDKEVVDKVETDEIPTEAKIHEEIAETDKLVQEDKEEDNTESDKALEEAKDNLENDLKTAETESKESTECNKEASDSEEAKEHINEVEIQCASSSLDSFKFSIQTNLSILSSHEEMSALALATLSEIKADLESSDDLISKEEPKMAEPRPVVPPVLLESEMVPIEGNLTVVSEKDLADGQVEITSEQVISPKRPITLSNFSMDFSDSLSDSNSNSTTDTSSDVGKNDFNSKGTEFTPKAFTKQMKKVDQKKETTYGRLELINILEGNSDTEKKPREYTHPAKKSGAVEDICDFEEHIPSQIVCAAKSLKPVPMDLEPDYKELKEKFNETSRKEGSKTSVKSTTSKLLERLTTEFKAKESATKLGEAPVVETITKTPTKSHVAPSTTPKNVKYLIKPKAGSSSGKPIILSEQILKPATETPKTKFKKAMEDIEDVEAFVIHKDPNKGLEKEEIVKTKPLTTKSSGKAKILQQTIITPAGEIIQPNVTETQPDDNIFDINSMPIVLSDEILTPESIEKMPIVIGSDTAKAVVPEKPTHRPAPGKIITTTVTPQVHTPNKTIMITRHKPPRILQSFGNKSAKNSPLLPNTAKPGKYIIVPQSSIPPTKAPPKKSPAAKKTALPTGIVQKMPTIAPEPCGNKIMIMTNQQGQQQRLLLTPAHQKMLGYQNQKVSKTIVKGNVMQKSVLAAKSVSLTEGTSAIVSKTSGLVGQKVMVGVGTSQGLITTTSHQMVGPQGRIGKTVTRRSPAAAQKLGVASAKPQKTILIKNQHGQTVRKIQGTDDELLDKQVAEQLEAIKASSGMKFNSQQKVAEIGGKATPKTSVRRFYTKRAEPKIRGPPPLTGIQQSPKPETVVAMPILKKPEPVEAKPPPPVVEEQPKTQQTDRPLNQLVIQDSVGNQTTITEGQILALPSETVDGQPQSYMLVTLDESGNLTPLNSEALMSLDPNLGLGGDLSNMVLQIDQSALTERPQQAVIKTPEIPEPVKPPEVESPPQQVPEPSVTTEITETLAEQKIVPAAETLQAVPPSTNGDPGQQLIVTGDPIATQKFLESLTEGTTDLANILANAEGNSILIQADGQQILINTNTDNQMLLSMNNDNVNVTESTEGGGNPIFATQPSKNQDILAAALADTDVFQQDHPSSTQSKIVSQLSPNNPALYPMNVGNVLETSLTLSSPIMTPLEVPSTNSKKIPDDEADILTQVPKNVDLPITITDPNISQTVANQQVSAMIANELQANLELALPISESTISTVSTEMNSPSYVYSLPTLDESVEIAQKPFNGSMPLLNEDVEESISKTKSEEIRPRDKSPEKSSKAEMSFLAEEEGRFTLGGEMCSSLSEPPPEMFDLPEVGQTFSEKGGVSVGSLQSTPDVSDNASKDEDTTDLSHADTSSEGSCEIPLQPPIVAKSLDLSRNLDSLKRSLGEVEGESKKCKFD